jgi:hypothetical protein
MRCCGSPTTSTADARVEPPSSSGVRAHDVSDAREAAAAFTALLLRIALEPLAKPLGFYGDVAVDACARAMARNDGGHLLGGLAEALLRSGTTASEVR